MKFDFKVETWERVLVDEKYEDIVLQGIKDGTIKCSDDIFNIEGVNAELVSLNSDCIKQMTIEENNGFSTIEVLNGIDTIYIKMENNYEVIHRGFFNRSGYGSFPRRSRNIQ